MARRQLETERDRESLLSDWDVAFVGGVAYPALFDDDYIETLEIQGSVPRLLMRDSDVLRAGIVVDTAINHIERFSGESHTTDYRVKVLQPDPEGDASLTLLILEEQ